VKRDKNQTRLRLLTAVGSIIREQGFEAVGVNAVARKAGVDKVLLYRYFGDLNTLLKEYVSASDYYRAAASTVPPSMEHFTRKDLHKVGTQILLGQFRRLRESPDLQEIYRWELSVDNRLTRSLAEQREREGTALLTAFAERIDFSKADLPAMVSVILAGGIHLILRSKSANVFNGLELGTPAGWQRIEQAIDGLLGLAMGRATIRPASRRRALAGRTPGSRKQKSSRTSSTKIRKGYRNRRYPFVE